MMNEEDYAPLWSYVTKIEEEGGGRSPSSNVTFVNFRVRSLHSRHVCLNFLEKREDYAEDGLGKTLLKCKGKLKKLRVCK